MCEFYKRMVGELAGEVWVDVLHLFSPCLWAFPVENSPPPACKIIRHFLPMADIESTPTIIRTFVFCLSFFDNSYILFDIHPYHI